MQEKSLVLTETSPVHGRTVTNWNSDELGEYFNLFSQYLEEQWCLIVFEELKMLFVF